jgi:hypothetical protein
MTAFDNGLWTRLVEDRDADRVVLAPPPRPRRTRPAVLTLGAVAIAAAVTALVLVFSATTSTPPAYALTLHSDGTATITLHDLTTGIPALNARLAKLGIKSTVVPIRAGCRVRGFGLLAARGSLSETVTVGNRWIPSGYRGFLAAEQLPNGKIAMAIGTMKPPIPSCFPATPTTIHLRNSPAS